MALMVLINDAPALPPDILLLCRQLQQTQPEALDPITTMIIILAALLSHQKGKMIRRRWETVGSYHLSRDMDVINGASEKRARFLCQL